MIASVLAWPSISPIPAPATMIQITWGSDVQVRDLPGPQREPGGGQAAAEHHGPLGPDPVQQRPPICAQTTKPRKKYKMSRLDVVAFSASAICP